MTRSPLSRANAREVDRGLFACISSLRISIIYLFPHLYVDSDVGIWALHYYGAHGMRQSSVPRARTTRARARAVRDPDRDP